MDVPSDAKTDRPRGWTTDTEMVREFDRPIGVDDALTSTVVEAIERWSELSDSQPLHDVVDASRLDGLFDTDAITAGNLPEVRFRFQDCLVTVLYGRTVRVIVERDR
jgi:hypothetical protein